MPGTQAAPAPLTKDPYDDLAQHYDMAIGSLDQRSDQYKHFFAELLKRHGCRDVLDVACGTGVDSAILLEHGFRVVSTDASTQMLNFAKKMKTERAGSRIFDNWIIKQASWETLPEDLAKFLPAGTQFDAVVCLANSISHVLDDDGEQTMQRRCLKNLAACVKPGGILLVDQRNYDAMLDNIPPPELNVYYKYQNPIEIKSTLVMENDKPKMVAIDFYVDNTANGDKEEKSKLRLLFYPHRLESFSRLLDEAFDGRAEHQLFGDFEPRGQVPVPGFYQHVMRKLCE